MSAPTLWGTLYCPYVQRAKIVFALVGKAYTFKAIDLAHKPAEFVKLSPYQKVPVLVDEGRVIYESAAINQYIDEKWGSNKLMGHDPYERAMNRVWTHWCNTRAAPAIYSALFNQDKAKDKELMHKLDQTFSFLEEKLPADGPFILGNRFQFGDVMNAPFLKRLPLLAEFKKYEMPSANKLPRVARFCEAVDKELDPLKLQALDFESMAKAYRPFVEGARPIDDSYWSY